MEHRLLIFDSFHFFTAKRNFNLEEYSFSLNTLAQAGDFKARHAVKARAGTKAAARPEPVRWQKVSPPKNCLRVVGKGSSAGKVVENGLGFFSLLGFSVVGTSLGEVLLPDSTRLRQAHSTSRGWMPLVDAHAQPLWLLLQQQVIVPCTRLVAKIRNVYVNPLVGKTYSTHIPYGHLVPLGKLYQRAQESHLVHTWSPRKATSHSSYRGCGAVPPVKEHHSVW